MIIVIMFWVVTLRRLVGGYQRFGETCYLHLQPSMCLDSFIAHNNITILNAWRTSNLTTKDEFTAHNY